MFLSSELRSLVLAAAMVAQKAAQFQIHKQIKVINISKCGRPIVC